MNSLPVRLKVSRSSGRTDGRLRARVGARITAKVIDLILVIAVAAILPYPIGPLLGFLYSLVADGMNLPGFGGQSIGKKLLKLQVVRFEESLPEGVIERRVPRPVRLLDSVYRNAPVGVATFFALIPIWGWLILALVGIPLMIMEIYLMITVATRHRLGDVMADTEVLEFLNSARQK
ncbi:MAG: hypothetical protein H7222_17825 [Methylotenera sp.]|nr:hypothetical protein [Oligoflexia bacterium]